MINSLNKQIKQLILFRVMQDRDQVYFDISVNNKPIGRIVFELFTDIAPITCNNFKQLSQRTLPEGYKGCSFHRIIGDFMAQGGDFTKGNGTGGKSIFNKKFADQNFIMKHQPYMLSMANAGPNTNQSQFFITFVKCHWLDGRHVVFGKVIQGKQVVDYLNKNVSSSSGKTLKPVKIQDCGVLYEGGINVKTIGNNPGVPMTQMVKSSKRQKVFFDIKVGDSDQGQLGKIIFELFNDITPKTCQNFKVLCTRNKPEGYRGNIFHRIITNFMAQGGDFTSENGTGGKSIYGAKFDDENFTIKHNEPYLLSMANAGKNTNGSQFFITFVPCSWLDGKHTVFGKVVQGKQIVDFINKNVASEQGKPKNKLMIIDSGIVQ